MEVDEPIKYKAELLHQLARGELEIAVGQGFDLDEVLEAADSLLVNKPNATP